MSLDIYAIELRAASFRAREIHHEIGDSSEKQGKKTEKKKEVRD